MNEVSSLKNVARRTFIMLSNTLVKRLFACFRTGMNQGTVYKADNKKVLKANIILSFECILLINLLKYLSSHVSFVLKDLPSVVV